MLHQTVATVVLERDLVVPVVTALEVSTRRAAHAALGLVHRAVGVVVVPDVDGHDIVEGARTPHGGVVANARMGAGRHQNGRSNSRPYIKDLERMIGEAVWSGRMDAVDVDGGWGLDYNGTG